MNLQHITLTLLLLLPSFLCKGMNQTKNFYIQSKTKFEKKTKYEIKQLLLENLMVCTYYSGKMYFGYPINTESASKVLAIVEKKQQPTQNNQLIQAIQQIQKNQRSKYQYVTPSYKKGKKYHQRGSRYTQKQGHHSTKPNKQQYF